MQRKRLKQKVVNKETILKIQLKRKEAIRVIQDYYLLNLSLEERGNILLGYGEEVINDDTDEWLPNQIFKAKNNKIIRDNFSYSKLITDDYLAYKIDEFYQKKVDVTSSKENNLSDYHSCVCCSYKVSKKRRVHSICPVCSWQDDFTEGDTYSSPNRSTLNDYKSEFIKRKKENPLDEKYIQYSK